MSILYREDELPRELVLSIQRILDLQSGPDADPLDTLSDDFDPVDVLNQLFPDESSLSKIDAVQARLAQNEADLQAEIDSLQEELRKNQDPYRMQFIQEMISDLLGQMSRIREKATESEAVVRNITKDIQVLDMAKKNLILSMTTLKRLQMLVNALTQLEDLVKERKYSDIAQTLAAVKQISASFKPYTSIQRISQVWRRVQEIQGEIRSMIDADFDAFYVQDPSKPIKSSTIASACLVIDVLGPDVRLAFIDRYVGLELKEYRRIFRAADGNEAGGLDNISRRFAWFRRLLQTHEVEAGRVFPPEWKVSWWLFSKFAEITRDDMSTLLAKTGPAMTVQLFLESLQQCMEFERSIVKKYSTPLPEILKFASHTPTRPVKSISSAFESHMGVYIDAQDKALSGMLSKYRGSKSRASLDTAPSSETEEGASAAAVLPSSTELFYFYGQSLEGCAKLSIGTGKALFDLCMVHKKWLRKYADEVLIASLKRPVSNAPSRRSMDTRFDIHELKNACMIINTSDYCQATAGELEEKMREKIDDEYKEKISFQAECDVFVSVISAAIIVQLRELEFSAEPTLQTMAKMAWPALRQVSGPSAYMPELLQSVEAVVEATKPLVEQKKYLRNFFDKAASLMLARFTNAMVKSRPLGEVGAEQLLIDLQVLKAGLLKLPGEALTTSSFTRNVTKNTANLDALLKVIVTSVDPPEGFILNYTLQIGDASFSNFQKILDLKGTPKAEQNALLDAFLTITSTKDELPTTSFLSALDMNPPAHPLTLGLGVAIPARSGTPPMGSGGLGGGSGIGTPTLSNVALGILGGAPGEGILAALGSPPIGAGGAGQAGEGKREVFSDFKRLVSWGRGQGQT